MELRLGEARYAGIAVAMKPAIERADLRLIPATTADLDRFCALLWDREVRLYLCDDRILPREMIAGFLEDSASLDAQGLGLWTIEARDGAFAGLAGLKAVPEEAASHPAMGHGIEPTIALDPHFWGRGMATGSLRALQRYAARDLRLSRMLGIVDVPNQASHRMMRQCGFREIGSGQGPKYPAVYYDCALTDGVGA